MISKRYIDQGIKIRKEFLLVNKQLEDILVEIKEVGLDLQKHTEELQNISDNLEGYSDRDSAKLAILNKLTEVEIQGNRLAAIYKPVNDNLTSLSVSKLVTRVEKLELGAVNEPLILVLLNPRITDALDPNEPLICEAI